MHESQIASAPFVALEGIQALGYLDGSWIKCIKNFDGFIAGETYPFSSETEKLDDDDTVYNLKGEEEEVTRSATELLIRLPKDESGHEHCFHLRRAQNIPEGSERIGETKIRYHHLMGDFVDHFENKRVPDVSETRKTEYEDALASVQAIEDTIATELATLSQ